MELNLYMEFEASNSTEAALHHYKTGVGLFAQKMPKIAEHYNAFTEECFKEGALSQKKST